MSLASITDKLRLISRDYGESFQARVTGDGVSTRFTLPRDNIAEASAYIAGTPPTTLTQTTSTTPAAGQFYLDARQGVIVLGTPLANGATLVVDGKTNAFLLPADASSYVDIAFQLHIRGRTPQPTYDNLPVVEEYLVSMLAAIELLWAQATEAAHEIDILTPEGVNIPRSQRFAQIMALLDRLNAHYKELSEALNVGPYAIRILTLRRVSRTTGRLVPVYVPQEFDDRTYPPVRVFPPIDNGLV